MAAKTWYQDCSKTINSRFKNPGLFIRLLAATSPRKSVIANWRLAELMYNQIISGTLPDLSRALPAHRKNILRAMADVPLSGTKVSAFAENLSGNLMSITIDIWIERGYPDKTHAEIENRIRRGSKRLKIKPAEYQAIVWTRVRLKYGKKPVSFNSVPHLWQLEFKF